MPENEQRLSSEQLEEGVAQLDETTIPQEVAVSRDLPDYENRKVVFSFSPYNSNLCRIHSIDKPEAKKLAKELKKVSNTLAKHFRHQHASGIACKPVHNSGNYEPLFAGLSADIEILEIDYSGPGRVFGFLAGNVFNVVAIGKEHYK